jgi:hypothetical protein
MMIYVLTGAATGAVTFLLLFTIWSVLTNAAKRRNMMRCVWCGEFVSLDTERDHWQHCVYHPARHAVGRLQHELNETLALLNKLQESA